MGALDDAIREHLELKRRHGASEEEIQQAEAEALGPARREPGVDAFADEPDLSPPPPPPPPAATYDEPFDQHFDDDTVHEPYIEEVPPFAAEADDHPPPPAPDSVPLDPTALRALPGELAAAGPPPVSEAPVEEPPVEEPPVEAAPAEDAPVEAPEPGTPKPHGDPAFGDDLPPGDDSDRASTAILDDPLRDAPRPPIHHEPGEDEPPAPARPQGAGSSDEDVLEETPDFLQDTPDHDKLWFEQKPPRDFDLDD
jgi:hypothetical protein